MQEQMLLAKSTSSKMTQRFIYAWPVPGAERKPMWLGSSESRDGKGGAVGEIIRGGYAVPKQDYLVLGIPVVLQRSHGAMKYPLQHHQTMIAT